MKKNIMLLSALLVALTFSSCKKDPIVRVETVTEIVDVIKPDPNDPVLSQKVMPGFEEGHTNPSVTDGVKYMFDNETCIPEVYIKVSVEEWNKLLAAYDVNNRTREDIHADMSFVKGDEAYLVKDVALSIKGNTSRRRPEGSSGQEHRRSGANWHHCHFGISLDKYQKDNAIGDMKKLVLKWFKDDGNYVRELYCYDLFRRAGVWTGPEDIYVRVFIQVGKDLEPAYFGVYQMYEPYDYPYLVRRKGSDKYGNAEGNLWACNYGATLTPSTIDKIGQDGESGMIYELLSGGAGFDAAKAQMSSFITKLNTLEGKEFHDWIGSVIDIDFLLKTYAINVGVGMWDDYWNNDGNNLYLYFNSTDQNGYKMYFLPHDYDNTLGTTSKVNAQTDAVTHDPWKWGPSSVTQVPLLNKILAFEDYRKMYSAHLKELAQEGGLLTYESSIKRINDWQALIKDYVSNDTGEDMELKDVPASWGNHPEYRVLEDGEYNFFRVKTATILSYYKQYEGQ